MLRWKPVPRSLVAPTVAALVLVLHCRGKCWDKSLARPATMPISAAATSGWLDLSIPVFATVSPFGLKAQHVTIVKLVKMQLFCRTVAKPQLVIPIPVNVGHLGVGYARIDSYDQGAFKTYSANYAHRIGQRSTLSLLATRAVGPTKNDSFAISLLIPFDHDIVGSANVTNRGNQTDSYVSASKALGTESGTGWRVLGGARADQGYGEAGLYYQGSKGLISSDFSASDDQKTVRLGAQGGLVAIGGNLFASRKIQDSFALVEVPGYANVGVGFQSSILTRTNADGKALIPRLLPYRANSIRLDPSELPISAEIDSIEQVVVPAARTGVRAAFPVRSGRAALIKILFDDGQFAPAGAEIALVGDSKEFFVARRGEAFITGLQPKTSLTLKWNEQQCKMVVDLPRGKVDEIAKVGPIACKGLAR